MGRPAKGLYPRISAGSVLKKEWRINKYVYIMAIPVVTYYILFHFVPMYGAIIAFKDYSPAKGIWGSAWVGFKHFRDFFSSIYFTRIVRNTIVINLYLLVFGFPLPILLALLLNEIKSRGFKRVVQTTSYLPHFISMVVLCGMVIDFTKSGGVISQLLAFFGVEPKTMLLFPEYFRPIYVISDIWKELGWNSIIYIAAIAGIDAALYEAATMDGAGRLRCMWHITLPGIMPTIVILLILRIGQMMNVGFEKIILLYNENTYETADVISSYVYRKGILEFDYSYSTAVGLFNSVINCVLLLMANTLSKRFSGSSLW